MYAKCLDNIRFGFVIWRNYTQFVNSSKLDLLVDKYIPKVLLVIVKKKSDFEISYLEYLSPR